MKLPKKDLQVNDHIETIKIKGSGLDIRLIVS